MKKFIFIFLAVLVVYLGFLLGEFLYALIIMENSAFLGRAETFTDPLFHSVLAILLTLFLSYLTKKK